MEKISRSGFLKLAAAAAMSGVTAGALTACNNSASSSTAAASGAAVYTPGTYTAKATGMGEVTVSMTFTENAITDVTVDTANETIDLARNSAEDFQKALLDAQSAEIDGVSGSTITSDAVMKAAKSCYAQAKDIISDLMTKTTKVAVDENEQGYLGIQLQNIDSQMAQAYGMPEGIYVYKIVAGGAASRSDLRERDIITKFDGEKVKNGDDLKKLLTYYKAGSTVTMTVQSLENGKYVERNVQITLGS